MRVFRIELERCVVVGDSVIQAAKPEIDQAASVQDLPIAWPQPQRLVAVVERLLQVAISDGQRPAALIVIFGIRRFKPDRLVVVGDSAVVVALGVPGKAAAVIRYVAFRVEPNHLVEVGDGAVIVSLGAPSETPIVVGAGIFWIETDRLVVIGDSAVVVALGLPSNSPI